MERSSDEQVVRERFSKIYQLSQSGVMRGIERSVCGCDYGATSWTTTAEARDIGEMLGLRPGKRLLEVGAGSGWPGVYLAKETGCDIAMIDLPLTGLRIALERAASDRVAGACWAAVADAAAMPVRSGWFDAILHSDVLCCLTEKLAVLKSCRRAVRADGRMVFSVILITPGLEAADYQRAASSGPPFIETDSPYPELLGQAGWDITDHLDLTAEYRATAKQMLDKLETHAAEIALLFGDDDASQERSRRRAAVAALERGLLRRELFGVVPSAGGD
ncbi:MAG: class I SAM-dependent methyltransferase [Alphaproteobacteria bacterium]